MNIGKLDSKISIYCTTSKTSEYNEETPIDVLLKKIWAHVEPRTGSLIEGRPAETMLSKTTHVVHIRAEAAKGIEPNCHIIWRDTNGSAHRLNIDYILPPARASRFSTIYAQEVV